MILAFLKNKTMIELCGSCPGNLGRWLTSREWKKSGRLAQKRCFDAFGLHRCFARSADSSGPDESLSPV
jgi:hypothetical protein